MNNVPSAEINKNIEVKDKRPFWWTCVDIAVLRDKNLNINDKAIYAVLCSFAASQDRTCFPSIALIAETAGCSDRTVQRALLSLEKAGYIKRQNRYRDKIQTSSIYTIIGCMATHSSIRGDCETPPGCQDVTGGVTHSRTELEPEELELKDTPTEEAIASGCSSALMEKIPAAMKSTAEYMLLKTGRKGLIPSETGAILALEKIHYPARIQQEISVALERFARMGRPPDELTFEYIYESLRRQKSKKEKPKTVEAPSVQKQKPIVTEEQEAEHERWIREKYGRAEHDGS